MTVRDPRRGRRPTEPPPDGTGEIIPRLGTLLAWGAIRLLRRDEDRINESESEFLTYEPIRGAP